MTVFVAGSVTPSLVGADISYSDGVAPAYGQTNLQTALDAVKPLIATNTTNITTVTAAAAASTAAGIVVLATPFNTAALAAGGAALFASYTVGTLPANARVLGCEIECTQTLAAVGLTTAVATMQNNGATAGEMIAAATIGTAGLIIAGGGLNPYVSRGGQTIKITLTIGVALLNTLSAGALTARVIYFVKA